MKAWPIYSSFATDRTRRVFLSLACEMKVSDVLPMLNYGPPSWVYGEITVIAKQTDVCELLLGQCCDDLFAIVAVSCMRPYVL